LEGELKIIWERNNVISFGKFKITAMPSQKPLFFLAMACNL